MTVNGGICKANGVESNSVELGKTFTLIKNGDPDGKVFSHWDITGANTDGIDLTNGEVELTMPATDVTATAVFVDAVPPAATTYKVNVTNGVCHVDDQETYDVEPGKTVMLDKNGDPAGKVFDKWVISGVDTSSLDLTQGHLEFTMPDNDVTVEATYTDAPVTPPPANTFKVHVTDGTCHVDGNETYDVEPGKTVMLDKVGTPVGMVFEGWNIQGIDTTGMDLYQEHLEFTMPNNDVTAEAVFGAVPHPDGTFKVVVKNGTCYVDGDPAYYVEPGKTVILEKDADPAGMVFDKWVITGLDTSMLDLNLHHLEFTMPSNDVTAEAVFVDAATQPEPPAEKPEIIAGAEPFWTLDSDGSITVTSNADFADFLRVLLDGIELPSEVYTVKSGSTIVTLNGDFLNQLPVGRYLLEIESKTGIASTILTIQAAEPGDEADKNDEKHVCDLEYVKKVPATTKKTGKKAYYQCKECGKYYEDAKGTREIKNIKTYGIIPKLTEKDGYKKSPKTGDDTPIALYMDRIFLTIWASSVSSIVIPVTVVSMSMVVRSLIPNMEEINRPPFRMKLSLYSDAASLSSTRSNRCI